MSEGIEVRPDAVAVLRPPNHIIQFAVEASLNSPCQSKRGVAIFDDDALMATGWNDKPRGFECDGSDACKATCGREAIHAEQMALMGGYDVAGLDMLHVKTVDGVLIPSSGPSCVQCSKLILHSRLAGMWLYHADGWKRYGAAEFHRLSLAASQATPDPRDAELAALREQVARLRDVLTNVRAEVYRIHDRFARGQMESAFLRIGLAITTASDALHATPAPTPSISPEQEPHS